MYAIAFVNRVLSGKSIFASSLEFSEAVPKCAGFAQCIMPKYALKTFTVPLALR